MRTRNQLPPLFSSWYRPCIWTEEFLYERMVTQICHKVPNFLDEKTVSYDANAVYLELLFL